MSMKPELIQFFHDHLVDCSPLKPGHVYETLVLEAIITACLDCSPLKPGHVYETGGNHAPDLHAGTIAVPSNRGMSMKLITNYLAAEGVSVIAVPSNRGMSMKPLMAIVTGLYRDILQ